MRQNDHVPAVVREAEGEIGRLSSHPRFATMDGIRGMAALVVVLFHSYKSGGFVPNGPLAVDLFFILSGFVIAFSYGERLETMPRRTFILGRFVRLYPMLLIGAAGGIALAIVHNVLNPSEAYEAGAIATSGGLSLLVLPYFGDAPFGGPIFSFNPPIWSLFFEIVANLAFIAIFRLLSIRVLVAITVTGLVGVALCGEPGGGSGDSFLAGFPRVMAGFFGGVLLFRLWRADRLPRIRANLLVLSIVLLALFCVPVPVGGLLYLPAFALLWLVVMAATAPATARARPYCEFLGLISYPVYLVHWLTLYIAAWIGTRIGLIGDLYAIVVAAHLLAIPFIGYAVARFYETPARLFLKQRLAWVALRVERRTAESSQPAR